MIKKLSTQTFVSIKLVDFSEIDKEKFKSILDLAESRLDIPWRIVDSEEADFYLFGSRTRLKNAQDTLLQTISIKQCVYYTDSTVDSNENELNISGDNIPSVGSLVQLFNHLITIEIQSNVSGIPKSIESRPIAINHDPEPSFDDSIKTENVPKDIVVKPVVPPSSNSTAIEKKSVLKNDLDSILNDRSHSESKLESTQPKKQKKNDPKKNRKAIRYAFDPIEASLEKKSLAVFNKNLTLRILNVSSNGVLIELDTPSKLRGQVTLEIQLDPQHTFIIPARVVRNEGKSLYGLQFLKSQHELINYLVSSKLSFIFS